MSRMRVQSTDGSGRGEAYDSMKFIIKDWAGNICFHGKQFPDFEDAWGFIREVHADDEEMWQEYEVEEATA